MKLLKDILYKVRLIDVVGNTNCAIEQVTMDSRQVRPFSVFVAVKGTQSDGHAFIDKAIAQGAIAIVCEDMPSPLLENIVYVQVSNASEALGIIACNFYDNPSEEIKLVAITGTNGKTTTATLLYRLAKSLGYKSGLISTVVNIINGKELASTHTTPDAVSLNKLLREMVEAGCSYCFMEASSHALHQNRMAGLRIAGGVYMNISHDHLDYHKTFNHYIGAKKILFDILPSSAFALVNKDDRHAEVMLQNTKAKKKTFALKTMADYKAQIIENSFTGLQLNIDNQELHARLIGSFNAYNILAVYGAAVELGWNKLEVLTALSMLEAPSGRFQYIKTPNNITAIVDYAHTPDALENVLSTIKNIRSGNEKLITLVGCGGDRDAAKRPIMAQIAADMSDKVILTSDNPRSEDPETILHEMRAGLDPIQMKKTISLSDRKEAIRLACTFAEPGDIILIAGKGHEKYQEINGVKHPFDDYAIVGETLNQFNK